MISLIYYTRVFLKVAIFWDVAHQFHLRNVGQFLPDYIIHTRRRENLKSHQEFSCSPVCITVFCGVWLTAKSLRLPQELCDTCGGRCLSREQFY
jgi:hypothetical protein